MTRRPDFGDGPPCPEDPSHGRMYRADPPRPGREWWCPVSGLMQPDPEATPAGVVMPLQGGGGPARLARADKRERR
jgi:hypothetical protein